ncbi:hypothetical protein C8K63_12234 [Pseudomonas sp. GV085]|nr:hypothetical protein C8K63_12234 [Pseudomonas sp. GV085]
MPAMVVNDNACEPDKRGALESIIASKLALVGAGLSGRRIAAKVVNDNACKSDKRGARESIAGKPAPTGIALSVFPGIA